MIRLAVVGYTGYGWSLVQQIQKASRDCDCRLVAAADNHQHLSPERTGKLVEAGVELFDDAIKMYQALRGRCEAIYIATGINSHAPLMIAAVKAGYPVHLEKPPAATIQEVDQMLQALHETGLFCQIGFQAVNGTDLTWIKEKLASGALGEVKTIACRAGWPRDAKYYQRNEWAGRLKIGKNWVLDGPAMNALAHQTTNMLYLASPLADTLATPVAVRGELYHAGAIDGHDTAAIEIRTAEGPVAYFLGSHTTAGRFGPIIEVQAERGKVLWERGEAVTLTHADGRVETAPSNDNDGRGRMVATFIEAVRKGDGAGLRCPLEQARKFSLALNGAHESSRAIHRIAPEFCTTMKAGTLDAWTVVTGLDDLLTDAAARCCLLSDLPNAPSWARKTDPFNLSGYKSFPRQFQAD